MTGDKPQTLIRVQSKELLESGQVQCVIGYETGSRGQVRPVFIYKVSDVDRLVWNQGCTHNLVTYLRDLKQAAVGGEQPHRVAIVVKPCDSHALNILMAEEQIERDNLYVIGVVCAGIVEGAGFVEQGDDTLQARCLRCSDSVPVVSDILVGENLRADAKDDFVDVAELEALSTAGRMGYWLKQFERCILCYACRQVCPGCYCSVCMFERDDSLWMGIATGLKEKALFHLGRAYHLATRCIGCDECERVCPMELPLSLLNRKLSKQAQELFNYHAGDEPTQSPLLTVLSEGEEFLI